MGWTKAKVLVAVAAAAIVTSGAAVAVRAVLAENRGTLTADRQFIQPPPQQQRPAGIARPEGVVLGLNGRPLKDVSVLISTSSDRAYVGKPGVTTTKTDADGRFSLPAVNEPYTLIAWHDDAGFAELTDEQLAATGGGGFMLYPWGRVEGTVVAGGARPAGRCWC